MTCFLVNHVFWLNMKSNFIRVKIELYISERGLRYLSSGGQHFHWWGATFPFEKTPLSSEKPPFNPNQATSHTGQIETPRHVKAPKYNFNPPRSAFLPITKPPNPPPLLLVLLFLFLLNMVGMALLRT